MYLSRRKRDIFAFIRRYIKKYGYSPTLEEIAEGMGLSSISTVHKHLKRMQEQGLIKREANRSRSIELLSDREQPQIIDLPILGLVAAGAPIEALEDREWIGVPQEFLKNTEMFVLRVKGDSMIDEQIRDGDHIIIERRSTAENGEMVVALINERDATVKKFYRESDGKIRLQPANPSLKPLFLDENKIEVKGVVVGLLRKY